MLDMSWGEILVIGTVALIVIGPKDLPRALRTVGNMVGKVRRMAGEFQSQFNDAMREAELDDVRRQIQGINQSVSSATTGVDPLQTARNEIRNAIEAPAGGTAADPAAGTPTTVVLPDPEVALPPPPEMDPAQAVAQAVERERAAEPVAAPAERPAAQLERRPESATGGSTP